MFKYLKYLIFIFLFFQTVVYAGYNDVLVADIQYDWIDKTNIEKEAIISEVHDILFENGFEKVPELRSQVKPMVRDKEWRKHYLAASAGRKEYGEYNISAFYTNRGKYIYMYALQDKKDVTKKYYYDALGHLRYVDFIYGEYPEYPYYAFQYEISGKPVSAVYYVSKDNQYMFNPDESFKGVWYKYNMYDEHSKIILKRTSF